LKAKARTCLVKCLDEPLASALAAEDGYAAIARERQFAWLMRFVVAPAALFKMAVAGN
jgi:hypothetical protein